MKHLVPPGLLPGQSLTTLLFEWPIKQAPRLALPLFILLAGFLHLSTIYLFNIVYQPAHVSKPVAAQVLFLLPGSPAAQQLAPWLAANDPSIFSPLKTVQATRPAIATAIYELHQTPAPLHSLPPHLDIKSDLPLPPTSEIALPQGALLDSSSTSAATPLSTPPHVEPSTTVQLLDDLAARAPLSPATLGHPEISDSMGPPLLPTKLTLQVDAMGIPRHVIILQSSGNSTADETASRWAMASHFAPADQVTWGTLLILWNSNPPSLPRQEKENTTPSNP